MIRNYVYVLFLCVFAAGLWTGCSFSRGPALAREDFMKSVYMNEIQPALALPGESGDLTLSFRQALELSVLRDENLALLYFSWKKDRLNLAQARSMLFPRVNLRVLNETYYSKESGRVKNNIDGGVQLQYNLLNVLFQRDNISVETAAAQQSILKGRIEVRRIFSRLLTLLMELEFYRDEVRLREKALQYAQDALTVCGQLAGQGKITPGAAWKWSDNVLHARENLRDASHRLGVSQRSLKYMLGKIDAGKVDVTGAGEFLPPLDNLPDEEINIAGAIGDAWNRRHEVKLAELNLFLAEMKLLKSKLSWLNYFRISLGFGRFYIYRDAELSNITLNTSIALPILDLGDARRVRKKAEIDRDMARVKAVNLARSLAAEVGEAVENAVLFKQALEDASAARERFNGQEQMVKRLIQLDQAGPLDLYAARLASLEAGIRYHRARFQYRQAAVHLQEVRGALLDRDTEETLMDKLPGKNETYYD
jgi:outer membrane protein TolC